MRAAAFTLALLLASAASAASPQKEAVVRYFQDRLPSCWNLPAGTAAAATIRFRLEPDGAVRGTPEIVSVAPPGADGDTLARSAVRAILKCGPYTDLAAVAPYKVWEEVTVNFDPGKMF